MSSTSGGGPDAPVRVVARRQKLALSMKTLACYGTQHSANRTVDRNGASMPDQERGSGLGDRSHGGEVAEVG